MTFCCFWLLLISGCSTPQAPEIESQEEQKIDDRAENPSRNSKLQTEVGNGAIDPQFAEWINIYNLCLEATVTRVEKDIASYGHKDNATFLRTQVQPPLKRLLADVNHKPIDGKGVLLNSFVSQLNSLDGAVLAFIEAFDTKDDGIYASARQKLNNTIQRHKQFEKELEKLSNK